MRHGLNKNGSLSFCKDGYLNTVLSVLKFKRIFVSVTRAKLIKPFVERNITLAKKVINTKEVASSLHSRRVLSSRLGNQENIAKDLIDFVNSSSLKERNGGYTRIVRAGFRQGDKTDMCFLEIIS